MQLVLAVVPFDEHLEHRLVLGQAAPGLRVQPVGEEAHDLLGDRGELVDPLGVVGCVGLGGQGGEAVAHPVEDAGPLLVDERLVEPPEAHAAGEVAHDGEAQLGGDDEPVERVTCGGALLLAGSRLAEPALQDGGGELDLRGRALLREEDAEDGLLEHRGALEVGHAVVAQHPGELVAELVREPGPLGVEALQVGVEVLLGTVHEQLGVSLLVDRPVAAQLGEVGDELEHGDLLADGHLPLGGELVARGEVGRELAPVVGGIAVEAEHRRGQVTDAAVGPLTGRRALRPGVGQVEVDRLRGTCLGVLLLVACRLEPHEGGAGLDLAPDRHEQLAHPRREGRRQHGLHLHRLEDEHGGARRDLRPDLHGGCHDEGRGGRADDATLVA